MRASSLLRAHKNPLINAVARELGMERYSIQQILRMLIERSEYLKLYVQGNRRDALQALPLDARAAHAAVFPRRDPAPSL